MPTGEWALVLEKVRRGHSVSLAEKRKENLITVYARCRVVRWFMVVGIFGVKPLRWLSG